VARARWLLGLPIIVQAGFFAMQAHLLLDDLKKFGPSGSAYGSVYYFLLGAHEAHVAVGVLLSVFLLYRLLHGLTNYRLIGLQSTVFYWHFVNFLTLCVVATELTAA
jgi:heme/copper-type cytochrome/quinol oxidase subunit 3